MRWPDDLLGWPHAEASRRVPAAPHRWHVQEMGTGPTLLLLHGAGGALHSWRGVLPRLAEQFHAVAIDLPGHGLTQLGTRSRSGLDPMTQDVLALCEDQGWSPEAVIGHSAGGAVALRMAQLAPTRVSRVVGINPALGNFKGLAGLVFPAMAKLLAATPFTADFFARSASRPERVRALLRGTGSSIDAEGERLYHQLVADRGHVDGALLMMAQWSLDALLDGLRTTLADTLLLTGRNDKTVPYTTAEAAGRQLPQAQVQCFEEYGHLVHEEAPADVARTIAAWLKEKGPRERA